jgi:hypothetical protein
MLNLCIGPAIANNCPIFHAVVGYTEIKHCLVTVTPIVEFSETSFEKYKALSTQYPNYLVRIYYCIKGHENVYIVFEHQLTLADSLAAVSPKNRYYIFQQLLFKMVQLLKANIVFEDLTILPELIQVDNDMAARLLFLPILGRKLRTFSTIYSTRESIRFDLGITGHLLLCNSLPACHGVFRYIPSANQGVLTEFRVIVDRLILNQWSRRVIGDLAMYILYPVQRANLLSRLIRNCNSRGEIVSNLAHSTEKHKFMNDMADRSILSDWRGVYTFDWSTIPELGRLLALNNRLNTGEHTNINTRTTVGLLNLLRHSCAHLYSHYADYQNFFCHNVDSQRNWDVVTVGDFVDLIERCFPLFFILIFEHAEFDLPNQKILNKH